MYWFKWLIKTEQDKAFDILQLLRFFTYMNLKEAQAIQFSKKD
jgi:hypothetical protein